MSYINKKICALSIVIVSLFVVYFTTCCAMNQGQDEVEWWLTESTLDSASLDLPLADSPDAAAPCSFFQQSEEWIAIQEQQKNDLGSLYSPDVPSQFNALDLSKEHLLNSQMGSITFSVAEPDMYVAMNQKDNSTPQPLIYAQFEQQSQNVAQQAVYDKAQKEKKYICAESACGRAFLNRKGFGKHCSAHKKIPHRCGRCNRLFDNKISCAQHVTIHLPLKPYVCTVCDNLGITKSFGKSTSLKNHLECQHSIQVAKVSADQKIIEQYKQQKRLLIIDAAAASKH